MGASASPESSGASGEKINVYNRSGGRLLDEQCWRERLPDDLFDEVVTWLQRHPFNIGHNRWIDDGASGSHVAAVHVAPKHDNSWGGILKLIPSVLVPMEFLGIREAAASYPPFVRDHIGVIGVLESLGESGRGVHLQRLAHHGPQALVPLADRAFKAGFDHQVQAIVRAVVVAWNEGNHGEESRRQLPSRFLGDILESYGSVTPELRRFAESEGHDFTSFETGHLLGHRDLLRNPLVLLAGAADVADVRVHTGNGHGDFHLGNILVPAVFAEGDTGFTLIDLGRFSPDAPISQDAVKLMFSVAERWIEGNDELFARPALRAQLAELFGHLTFDEAPEELAEIAAALRAIHTGAAAWAERRSLPDTWLKQHYLTLVGMGLRKAASSQFDIDVRRWAFAVAAVAAEHFFEAHVTKERFEPLKPDVDLVGQRPAGARVQEWSAVVESGPGVGSASDGDRVDSPDETDRSGLQTWQQAAVGISYDRLFDARPMIDDLVALVESPTAGWAVTVSGPGGIGKTAVTYEAVSEVAQREQYSKILWVSGRAKDFGDGSVDPPIDWEDVVFQIGSQLECDMRQRRLWEREVARSIGKIGARERLLLVVDNLEAVNDADRLLDRLSHLGIGRPHKVVLASRRRLQNTGIGLPNVTVRAMRQPTAIAFIHHLGRDDEEMKHADARMLEPIYAVTEGNPFLIKLIVSRHLISIRSLEEILRDLQTNRQGGLGAQAKHWLFDQSLDEFATRADARSAAKLIGAFCFFPRGESVSRELLQEESEIDDDTEFMNLLEIAHQLELVRVGKGRREFSIHSLLYEFTRKELGAGR